MASVNSYLKKLLYQYDCVVVPELGAFLTHYQPASYTENSGLYLPPRKRVAFNEALRFDDGILTNYIMLHEPVTRDGAQQLITSFVSDLREQVEKTSRFELDGIGTFTQNEEGRLQFSPGLRQNFFGESYGMNAIPVQVANQVSKSEPVLEALPVLASGPLPVREDDAVLTPYQPARTYWRVAAAALLIGSLGAVSYFSVIQPGQPFRSSLDPANLLRIPVYSFFSDSEKKATIQAVTPDNSVTLPSPEISAEPVATVPAPVPPVVTAAPVPVPGVTESAAPVRTSIAAKSEMVKPVMVKKAELRASKARLRRNSIAPSPVIKPAFTGTHFTLIAGVFSSRSNAQSLTNQLHKAGYSDAFVIMPARGQKRMYKVAALGSADRDEMVAKVGAVKEIAGAEPWILKN